ncbi:hypothetical protein [Gemmata obscuriglobus]|uniref:hypothetical protein n=1 Tax=Gemmata obscuriglobus TaxID=114 RepID=UPI0002DE4877|nr:hypothetical protein [Gemmata obscuriglobus]
MARYIGIFCLHGVAGLRAFQWAKPVGAQEAHRTTLEAEFHERPPHTVAEAAERIATLTGVRRKETQCARSSKKSRPEVASDGGHPIAPE